MHRKVKSEGYSSRRASPFVPTRTIVTPATSRGSIESGPLGQSSRAKAARDKVRIDREELEQLEALQLEELRIKREFVQRKANVSRADIEAELLSNADDLDAESVRTDFNRIDDWRRDVLHQTRRPESISQQRVDRVNPGAPDTSILANLVHALTLPNHTLDVFDDQPVNFVDFIHSFEIQIEHQEPDPMKRLHYPIQFTSGTSKELVRSCASFPVEVAYQKAKDLLYERFGRSFDVAMAHVHKVVSGPIIKNSDRKGLLQFSDELKVCANNLRAIDHLHEINSADNLRRLVSRLPEWCYRRWLGHVHALRSRGRPVLIDELSSFVYAEAMKANDPVFGDLSQSRVTSSRFAAVHSQSTTQQTTEPTLDSLAPTAISLPLPPAAETRMIRCARCEQPHSIFRCSLFKTMKPPERLAFAREKGLCDICLKHGHRARTCSWEANCGIDGCVAKHARLLHCRPPSATPAANHLLRSEPVAEAAARGDPESSCSSIHTRVTQSCALPIVPIRVYAPGSDRFLEGYCLLDSGSDTSFCCSSLLTDLDIPYSDHSLSLSTLEKKDSQHRCKVTSLEVTDIDGAHRIRLQTVFSRDHLPIRMNDETDLSEACRVWPHLRNLNLPSISSRSVLVLIGQDVPEALEPLDTRRGPKGAPYAIRTRLGWCIHGSLSNRSESSPRLCNFIQTDEFLDEQLRRYFDAEFGETVYEPTRGYSVEDKAALHALDDSVRLKGERYEMALPWRPGCPDLPDNRQMALRRLEYLAGKFDKKPGLRAEYSAIMDGYISKGFAEPLPREVLSTSPSRGVWYIPHHVVYHPVKLKPRVVFDCAAQFKETSINKQLLSGPDLNNSLLGVLLRFRQSPVAVSADIEAMFHQVGVRPDDRDAFRFFWWPHGDTNTDPQIFRMTRFVFGAVCSPCCAVYALQKTAYDHAHEYDEATINAVLRAMYMDDLIHALDDAPTAIRIVQQLRELLMQGGFRLTKWISSDPLVMSSIPESDRAPVGARRDLCADITPLVRVLGIWWDVSKDCFTFCIKFDDKPATRRGVLSTICKMYDPPGFVGPAILPAKIILQELCRLNLSWDADIPDEHLHHWETWKSALPCLSSLSIPRCYKLTDQTVVRQSLHHFSDASTTGYGCGSYLRVEYETGDVTCRLVLGKSRVAPLKQVPVPRLELKAANLSATHDRRLRAELDLPIEASVFWTDSISVLHYIRNTDKRFQTFVANQLASIHEVSTPGQWRFVPTKINPADIASRGVLASDTAKLCCWLEPEFLLLPLETWPPVPDNLGRICAGDPEVKKPRPRAFATNQTTTILMDFYRCHSSWMKLKSSVAHLLRVRSFLLRMSRKKYHPARETPKSNPQSPLSAAELIQAEKAIVTNIQRDSFSADLELLLASRPETVRAKVSKTSVLRKLNPFVSSNTDTLLRVGGRLINCEYLDHDSKFPIILPGKHHVTSLLIIHQHVISGHSGREYILSKIRQKYWITNGSASVKRVIKQCFDCKRRNAPLIQQPMADLPSDRVTADKPPFSFVGLDYFGPFLVKVKRSLVKRYGCIFTCLTSRAVHVEVAFTLDTDSFLNALQRFIARRGAPELIRSDNGSNFKSGYKELKTAIRQWNQSTISNLLSQKDCQWIFNPPAASNWGGVWERQIRSIRKIMHGLLREQSLTDESLSTLMCLVESILNGRPLTPITDSPDDLECLTPNHLLMMRRGAVAPPGIFSVNDNYSRRRWKQVQYLADLYWKRWLREYLPLLQVRTKWNGPGKNVSVGDLLVLSDNKAHRHYWPLARVIEVFSGRDGLIRSAKVKTRDGIYTRPVNKLCLVEASN